MLRRRSSLGLATAACLLPALLAAWSTLASQPQVTPPRERAATDRRAGEGADTSERGDFSFTRVEYDSTGGFREAYYFYEGRLWQRWETDHPQADENFVFRLAELTSVVPNPRSVTRRLTDPDLTSFPFLYFSDVGWMTLDDAEVAALRDHLLRGGFLWVDDFWGLAEWNTWEQEMARVLPEVRWRDIPTDHQILRMLFPLEEMPQIPARDFAESGWTHDPPEIHRWPAYGIERGNFRGWFDDEGRLMAVASHNTDIADGWEREAYGQWYFEKYSTVAYALGVNIVLHGLVH
ncbi:MAG TPA: DUF4159 domain-containing protein [Thermoanaerobaculia bacterium]|nr:DUF4159 domain-containing protein [Thermoanaerobaculia bacterium]